MNQALLAHLNKHPEHLAKLRAWDRTTAPWVAFTGTWWAPYSAEELVAALDNPIFAARAASAMAGAERLAGGKEE